MKQKKLGRKKGHRNQLIKNLAVSLIIYERITTTAAKAKAVKGYVEHIISSAQKADDVNGLRMAIAALGQKKPAQKVIEVYKKTYKGQSGGYLRIIKLGERRGDNAPIVIIEFTRKSEQLLKAQKEKSAKTTVDAKPTTAATHSSDTKSTTIDNKPATIDKPSTKKK